MVHREERRRRDDDERNAVRVRRDDRYDAAFGNIERAARNRSRTGRPLAILTTFTSSPRRENTPEALP